MTAAARAILEDVAARHGVSVEAIHRRDQHKTISAIRAEAMRRVRAETALSLAEIGALFGRNHSTVLRATQKGAQ